MEKWKRKKKKIIKKMQIKRQKKDKNTKNEIEFRLKLFMFNLYKWLFYFPE